MKTKTTEARETLDSARESVGLGCVYRHKKGEPTESWATP